MPDITISNVIKNRNDIENILEAIYGTDFPYPYNVSVSITLSDESYEKLLRQWADNIKKR